VTCSGARGGATRRRPPLALAVAAIAATAVVLLPLGYLAVRVVEGGPDAWDVLLRDGTVDLVLRTAGLAAAVVVATILVGVPLAWLVVRTDLPGRRAWGVAAALPLVIPSYVAALALLGAFGPRGMLQRLLEGPFGVERLPSMYGFGGAVLALTLSTYPFVYLLTAASLRSLDPSLEEAARGLGHSRVQTFLRVTVPAIRPAVAAGALLVALYALSDFGAVSLMQFDSLTRAVFLQYRSLFDRTPAAVLSLVLVALTALILLGEARARSRAGAHSSARQTRPPTLLPLGRWRWPALAFCTVVVGVLLVVPVAVLVYWSARAVDVGHGLSIPWGEAVNSVSVAALAAAAITLAAVPVAVLAGRFPARWTRGLARLCFSANALPGIVVALALVFFAANFATPIYQSLALLVVAYGVRFFPEALAGVITALDRVNPRLEEAGRGLGRSGLGTFLTVTAPLMRPGMLAGATLVFLSTMKELPATLLLRPIGFDTLATEVWRFTSLASYSRAAPAALLLIAISAPLVYLVSVRGRPLADGGAGAPAGTPTPSG
jgi:iron(III) transport system permease protein